MLQDDRVRITGACRLYMSGQLALN
jgi:hypothetical protein